ncbi:MAG: autotransporter-associated beta strand repeat-containing protein [Verrucomicrobia bacterium]|nr:autotransporter-associated beta strand repeat-containing protein [Verrucomicrobiota bacterium]
MKPTRKHPNPSATSRFPGVLTLPLLTAASLAAWSGTAKAAELWWDGSGNWSDSKWSATYVPPSYTTAWNDDGTFGPTFIGVGGTVNVDGTYHVGAPGIGFDADGVILSGGVLVRTDPLINAPNTAGQTATINSELQGTVGLMKGRAGTLILSGANTYTGTTAINAGVVTVNSGGTLGNVANALTIGSGTSTAGTLNVNDNLTAGSLAVTTNGAGLTNAITVGAGKTFAVNGAVTLGAATSGANTKLTVTGATGTWNVAASGGTFRAGGSTANTYTSGTLDMSGLGGFNVDLGSSGSLFAVGHQQPGNPGASTNSWVATLAGNSTIKAATFSVGGNIQVTTPGTDYGGIVKLGSGTNIINANTIRIGPEAGLGRGSGKLQFNTSTGTLQLRAYDGTSNVTNFYIADMGNVNTSASVWSTVDWRGHSVDVAITNLLMSRNTNATGTQLTTSELFFDTGTLTVSSAKLGSSVGVGKKFNATITIGGGTANFGTGVGTAISLVDSVLASTPSGSATLQLNGGTTTLSGNLVRTDADSALTVSANVNLAGGTLDMSGFAIGTTNAVSLTTTSGTLKNIGSINSTGGAGIAKTGSGTLTLDGANAWTGPTAVSDGTLIAAKVSALPGQTASGKISVAAGKTLQLNTGGSGEFTATDIGNVLANATFTSTAILALNTTTGTTSVGTNITHDIALTKLGTGTLTLSGTNTYSGATTVSAGILSIDGSGSINNASAVTVNGGTFRYNNSTVAYGGTLTFTSGTIGGTNLGGSLGGQTIGTGQTLSPGNSPGTAVTTSQTWAGGGTYLWEINHATGTAGSDPGWDLETGSDTLGITATDGSKFKISVVSLTLANAGEAANFDPLTSYHWKIADFLNPVADFNAAAFNLDTSQFANPFTGTFGVALGGSGEVPGDNTEVYVTYVAVPETAAAVLGSLGLLILLRRRRA